MFPFGLSISFDRLHAPKIRRRTIDGLSCSNPNHACRFKESKKNKPKSLELTALLDFKDEKEYRHTRGTLTPFLCYRKKLSPFCLALNSQTHHQDVRILSRTKLQSSKTTKRRYNSIQRGILTVDYYDGDNRGNREPRQSPEESFLLRLRRDLISLADPVSHPFS